MRKQRETQREKQRINKGKTNGKTKGKTKGKQKEKQRENKGKTKGKGDIDVLFRVFAYRTKTGIEKRIFRVFAFLRFQEVNTGRKNVVGYILTIRLITRVHINYKVNYKGYKNTLQKTLPKNGTKKRYQISHPGGRKRGKFRVWPSLTQEDWEPS